MKKTVMRIDEFEGQCGYSYKHEPFCNGGHNCRHPEAAKENVNGEEVGYCYAFSCPLAPCADEKDFKDACEDPEQYDCLLYTSTVRWKVLDHTVTVNVTVTYI